MNSIAPSMQKPHNARLTRRRMAVEIRRNSANKPASRTENGKSERPRWSFALSLVLSNFTGSDLLLGANCPSVRLSDLYPQRIERPPVSYFGFQFSLRSLEVPAAIDNIGSVS